MVLGVPGSVSFVGNLSQRKQYPPTDTERKTIKHTKVFQLWLVKYVTANLSVKFHSRRCLVRTDTSCLYISLEVILATDWLAKHAAEHRELANVS